MFLKTLRFTFTTVLFLTVVSCVDSTESLPGNKLPGGGTTRELPEYKSSFENTQLLSLEFNHSLEDLDGDLVVGENLQLYQNGDSFAPLQKLLVDSKKYFLMNLLSFTCDSVTEPFVASLEKKAREGVDVRLIVNKGFALLSIPCLKRLETAGVKILKVKTHSSYFVNDKKELIIGSQSVARMFFLADGFNDLDRDMMLYAQGPLATDALRDFISIWDKESDSADIEPLHEAYTAQTAEEWTAGKRGVATIIKSNTNSPSRCRFIADRPSLGVEDTKLLWNKVSAAAKKEIIFSGVKVDIGGADLGKLLKEKSRKGISVRYLGNGYLSGNGEATMVFTEWSDSLKNSGWGFIAAALDRFSEWDRQRLAKSTLGLYEELNFESEIKIFTYFNFIHYKVWSFDQTAFYVGSANLDVNKFGKVYEAGVYCLDSRITDTLNQQLARDEKNSVLFEKAK